MKEPAEMATWVQQQQDDKIENLKNLNFKWYC